ncbi:MAG: hypothetical protein IJ088_06085, partial [Clostridia bacterium]|nr:hypothetical protein [Clostridia bacterium]
YTRDSKKYLTRLVQLALISQPLYAFGLAHTNPAMFAIPFTRNPLASAVTFYSSSWQTPSILLSLCLAAGILIALRDRNYILAIGIYVLCELFGTNLDYGINGIRLILLFYCLLEHPILMATLGSAFVIQWAYHLGNARFVFFGVPFNMEIFAIPSVLLCAIPMTRFFRLPRWFTYLFYPAHLILLWVLSSLIRPH